ncbi:MAG: hypothetical protein ABIL58_07045 [Pseudomonadota bacterium]
MLKSKFLPLSLSLLAAMGLSGLEAIQQYAALLGQAYANDPGPRRDPEKDAGYCTGAE